MEPESSLTSSERPVTGPYSEPVQSTPHPYTNCFLRSILSTHLHLDFPTGLLPSGFPIIRLYAFLNFPTHATCHSHLVSLIMLREQYKLWNTVIPSSSFGTNIFLSTRVSTFNFMAPVSHFLLLAWETGRWSNPHKASFWDFHGGYVSDWGLLGCNAL
jgi:hypothetical protein